jgi:UDP-glucuronate 4-epimerase
MHVLVTGAAGFIGSSLCDALRARGDQVTGLDNFDRFYDRARKEANLAGRHGDPGFTLVEGDVLDGGLLDRLLARGVTRVVHLAALAGVRPSIAEPLRYFRVNVEGTACLLEACRRAAVRELVVASSSSVYGARSRVPFSEEDPCDRPVSPYAASKKATEAVAATYVHLYPPTRIACLRFFTVYGPRQRPEMAIHRFVRLALEGKPLPMYGDGSSGRDYTFIDDIVAGTLATLDRLQAMPEPFRVYNLGGAQPVLLRELCEAIGEAVGRRPAIDERPWQQGDVPQTSADIRRAAAELGYAPAVPLREGLARFVSWYREQGAGV